MNTSNDFRSALEAAGLRPGEVVPDGKLRRCPTDGRKDDAGWYVLFADPRPAGAFGNWRTGAKDTWSGGNGRDLDPETQRQLDERIERARSAMAREESERHAKAAKLASKFLSDLPDATDENGYLTRKGVKACPGLKLDDGGDGSADTLTIPVLNENGKAMSLQRIEPDGTKRFMPGGQTKGGYFAVRGGNGPLYLVEGIATALSIHQATRETVLVAFNAGNLEAVARMARERYPEREIIICGDDDRGTEAKSGKNPGREAGEAAARAVGGKVCFPPFQDPSGKSDFNDMHAEQGLTAVRKALGAAAEPEPAATADDPWPEPVALPEGLPPVESFNDALLPEAVRPWAMDIAERVQCPPDFVAVAVLSALGSTIGRKVGVRPQAYTAWTETANLWALIIGRPGVLKSPAMEAALSPLYRLVAKAVDSFEERQAEYEAAKVQAKLKREAGEKAARAALKKDSTADISHLLEHEEEDPPVLRRYMTSNSTAEALGELLRQNPNGILVFRDELVSLLRNLDREEHAEARGFFLTGWSGNSPFVFDRIGRGLNLHIPAVCLSILGSTQPARIARYVKTALDGGEGDDGLIQRFSLAVWPDTNGTWKDVDRWPNTEAKNLAFRVFERLDEMEPKEVDARQDTGPDDKPEGIPYLRLSPEALGLFREWRQDLEKRLRAGDLHPAVESHLAKYRKLIPALALILHLSNGDTGPVSHHATLQALSWAEYLETHARRLYASVTAPEVTTAKAIIHKIRGGALPAVFAVWQVWRPGWSGLTDRKMVNEALELLVDLGWLVSRRKETGGRPSVEYEVNPKAIEKRGLR